MEQEFYRFIPNRFIFNNSHADSCKLKQLTNLFPDMKEIIELELFKINNLQRIIERLSNIYPPVKVVDIRDDSTHLFLGPYHICLGPAVFGALHFRNMSTALLAKSNSKISHEKKPRHDAILRRFRRAVRKLIFIKSIIDQLRLASILTPYNQYELYTHGIYDLVLSGQTNSSSSIFYDNEFLQQINDFHSMNSNEKEHSFLVSKFIKINTLLHLLSPSPHHSEHHSTMESTIQPKLDETTNETSSSSLLFDSLSICCVDHAQTMPLAMIPVKRSTIQQVPSLISSESQTSRRESTSNIRRKSSINNPNSTITASVPNLTVDDNLQTNHTVSNGQEDAFVNRLSTLLTNYLITQQSTIISSNNEKNSREILSNDQFNQLLERIKTTVDNNLSDHQNSSKKTSTNTNHHEGHSLSYQPIFKDENQDKKHKLRFSLKSQSFDDTNLEFDT